MCKLGPESFEKDDHLNRVPAEKTNGLNSASLSLALSSSPHPIFSEGFSFFFPPSLRHDGHLIKLGWGILGVIIKARRELHDALLLIC